MFKHLKQKLKNSLGQSASIRQERPMFHPARDWVIALTAFGVLLVGIALLGGYMYLEVERGEFFGDGTVERSGTPARLDRNALGNMIEFYEQRSTRHATFIENAPEVPHPNR